MALRLCFYNKNIDLHTAFSLDCQSMFGQVMKENSYLVHKWTFVTKGG